MASAVGDYSVTNAEKFGWDSVTGVINRERADILREYLVGPTVLDAGCGGGGFVHYLTEQGYDVTGVDKHQMYLDLATRHCRKGRYLQGDLTERLPFADKEFDTTYCFDVLEHVDDVAAIRELARVTRKRLILAVPNDCERIFTYRLLYPPYRDATHLRYYTAGMLTQLAANVSAKPPTIRGEQFVKLNEFVLEFCSPESSVPFAGRVYKRLFRYLVRRCKSRELHMNWVAVVDLE